MPVSGNFSDDELILTDASGGQDNADDSQQSDEVSRIMLKDHNIDNTQGILHPFNGPINRVAVIYRPQNR